MTTCLSPKDLLRPCTSIAYSLIERDSLQPDVDRLAGAQAGAARRLRAVFDEEHQLRALLARIEHRRRVLRLARKVGHLGRDRLRAAVAGDIDRPAPLDRAEHRFGNAETTSHCV